MSASTRHIATVREALAASQLIVRQSRQELGDFAETLVLTREAIRESLRLLGRSPEWSKATVRETPEVPD